MLYSGWVDVNRKREDIVLDATLFASCILAIGYPHHPHNRTPLKKKRNRGEAGSMADDLSDENKTNNNSI